MEDAVSGRGAQGKWEMKGDKNCTEKEYCEQDLIDAKKKCVCVCIKLSVRIFCDLAISVLDIVLRDSLTQVLMGTCCVHCVSWVFLTWGLGKYTMMDMHH